jgi:hypothetical protein
MGLPGIFAGVLAQVASELNCSYLADAWSKGGATHEAIRHIPQTSQFPLGVYFEPAQAAHQAGKPLPANHAPTISVVIPALNEAQNLPHMLPRIPDWIDEVLLVDGCSTDNTVQVAREL